MLLRWDSGGPSPRVAKLPLVSDREDTNLVACGDEAVERDVSRSAERDHELSQLALHSPAPPLREAAALAIARGSPADATRLLSPLL